MKRRIKFRAPDDAKAEQDMEAFVKEANSTLASLGKAERPNVEALARRPQKG